MTRAGVLNTIDTLLGSVSGMSPSFVAITRGEPLNIPATPWCSFWVPGLSVIEPMNTLGDESTITEITVRAYHPSSTDPGTNEAVVEQVWNGIVGIRASLLGDANLSGNASQIQLNNSTVDTTEINGVYYVMSTTTVDIWILGDTTVTPQKKEK